MSFTPASLDLLSEHAAGADEEGSLPEEVVAELTAAGFPRYFAPAAPVAVAVAVAGGNEELFAAVAAAAERCASAAWCAMLWALHGRYAARLALPGREEIWRDSPDVRISAAVLPPAGAARRVDGGWTVTGRWEFASGIEHAHWVLLGARRTDSEEVRICAVRPAELEIEGGWNAVGLRATGSHAVRARDLFVPDRRSMTLEAMVGAHPEPGIARRLAAPAHLVGPPLMAAVALGATRNALAQWTRGSGSSAGTAAEGVLLAAGECEAAQLLLTEAARRSDAGPTDAAAIAVNLRDAAVGVSILTGCVDRLLRVGGTASRGADGAFHRAWRDVHTVASHGALRLGTAAAAYARIPRAGEGS